MIIKCISALTCTLLKWDSPETSTLSERKLFIYSFIYWYYLKSIKILHSIQKRIQRFWKGMALYVGHHGWPTKKILGFRWCKKIKTTLETLSFWQNIYISIFKFYPFLHITKACQWNLINFSKFANALIKKEKQHLCNSQWEKKNSEKLDFVS